MSQPIDARFAREFLARLHGAVNRHDPEALAELCHEHVVWDDPAALEPLRGRAAVLGFHRDTMFPAIPDVSVELLDGPYLALDVRSLAVRLRIRGTMLGPLQPPGFGPTGGPIEFVSAEFSRFEDGLLVHHTVVLDMLALARQIGAVPAADSLGDRMGVRFQRIAAARARRRNARAGGSAEPG